MPEPSIPIAVEPYLTIQQASKVLGIYPWALRRAVKSGTIPAYTLLNCQSARKADP